MEVCSPRQQQIINLQGSQTQEKGQWNKLLKKTSQDGFTHGNPRPHSPIKIAAYTKGSWEDFIRRSDMIIENKGIRIVPAHKKDHFELGYGTIALIDEKDIFNLRGQKRINLAHKESHVFDAYRKKFSTNIMSDKDKLQWIERYRSDYERYHQLEQSSQLKAVNTSDLSSQFTKQKAPSDAYHGSYVAISENKKEKRLYQNSQLNLFKSEQKPTKREIQENYITSARDSMKLPNQYPISYEKYKQLNRVKSASPSVIINQQQSSKIAETLSTTSQQQASSQNGDLNSKKKVGKPLRVSQQYQQFLEYKKEHDSIKLG